MQRASCIDIQNSDSPVLYLFWQWRQCGGTRQCCMLNIVLPSHGTFTRLKCGGSSKASKKNLYVCVWRFITKWKPIGHLSSHFLFFISFWTFWLDGVRVESKKNPVIKFVGAEINRLTMLMQFVVDDMFHNNYLFKHSPRNSLWLFFLVRQHLHSATLRRNFPG